jgi:hypothetical protein
MGERLLNSTWWMAVMTMISATGAAALAIGYRGVFDLLAGRYHAGATCLGISLACGLASGALCKYRNDLL